MMLKKLWTLATVLLLAVTLTACGGTKTLESYVNSNKDIKQEIEKAAVSDSTYQVDIDIKENTLIYTFKYKTTLNEDLSKQAASYFKSNDATLDSAMKKVAKTLEDETKIEGIQVEVNYLNGNNQELYKATYDSK